MNKFLAKIRSPRSREILFWMLIGVSLAAAFFLIKDASLIADEGYHLPQIKGFMAGNYSISPSITVPPVYHAIMACILKSIGAGTVAQARLVSFLGAAAGIWTFYVLVSRLWPDERYLRTIQFVFFPILFPMFFLIYTDAWPVALILLSVERALAHRAWQSAAAVAVSVSMRQPNLIWAGFIWLIFVCKDDSFKATVHTLKQNWRRTSLPFMILFAGFVIFFCVNGGIAVGDRKHHEVSLNLANVWFFGLIFFFLFMPTCIGVFLREMESVAARSLTRSGALVGIFSTYLATYHVSHQYNQASHWSYLRNRILYWTTQFTAMKILSFVPVGLGLHGFAFAPMRHRRFKCMIPLSLVSIVVMPLIEQRYFLVPMALFLAFRPFEDEKWEYLNGLFYVILSYLILCRISNGDVFL